ncbi:hypothetical protein SDC9_153616 [bioreactor metagenome]|uniref:Uncharacterized protein n=1 Tax=bioreactor metagenome TaxID=1076179 RepID=A0A645EY14_9ZZZZ
MNKYNVGAMRLPDSNKMKAHRKGLHEDPDYLSRLLEINSEKLERQKKAAERTLLDVL